MTPLNRKLLRDLWRLRGQVFAIAAVMAAGIGVLVMALTTVDALRETALAYYERHAFADVFARVERAPDYLAERIRHLPGVQTVETRVVHTAILDVSGFEEPVIGQLDVAAGARRAPAQPARHAQRTLSAGRRCRRGGCVRTVCGCSRLPGWATGCGRS